MNTSPPSLSRRPARGLAGVAAIMVVAAIAVLAANLGLLSAAPSAAGKVGQLNGNNVTSLVSDSSKLAGSPTDASSSDADGGTDRPVTTVTVRSTSHTDHDDASGDHDD